MTNKIITNYSLAVDVLQVLDAQRAYFLARKNNMPSRELLANSLRLEKALRADCESIVRKVARDMEKLKGWNEGRKR